MKLNQMYGTNLIANDMTLDYSLNLIYHIQTLFGLTYQRLS